MRIGIDIGGTNTDSVLVNAHNQIIAFGKTPTTQDIVTGFTNALKLVPQEGVQAVIVGTTHATNAILERRGLSKVGVIRLAGNQPMTLPSCFGWPKELKDALYVGTITIDGGYNCDGKEITKINEAQIKQAANRLIEKGAESLAIVGVFSPLNHTQELEVKEIIGNIPVTLSHQIGGMGIVERENGAILNASLKKVLEKGFIELQEKIDCPLWITQNNGSLVDLHTALEFPILTLSAGPTNSFVGGAKLANLKDAIVVDVGGTSTDVGIVRNGYPRRCLQQSSIGGVALNDALPDVQAIAMGGGSHVTHTETISIGPKSCSYRLLQEGLAFGGNQLTLTDIALKLGTTEILGSQLENISLSKSSCQQVMEEAKGQVKKLIEKIGIGETDLPVVMIGGGASLFEMYHNPLFASVANAYGAAMAEVSYTVDTVVCLEKREEMLEKLSNEAINGAVTKGASRDRVTIVDQKIIPYHYVPGHKARVVMTASGSFLQP